MNRHLVAVKVGVERGTNQRMQLNRFAIDQFRLESLNAQAMQRRSAVQHHGMMLNHFFQSVPNFWLQAVDHATRRLDIGRETLLHQALHHERLEEFECHFFGQTALVKAHIRADNDNRTSGIIDALAQQVLAETAFFALQHIGERLQRTTARTRDRTLTARVIDQGIAAFLQQSLLVVDDAFRRLDFRDALQAVVAVDDATIQIVKVTRGETSAVELHHRTQFRRHNGNGFENHPLWTVLRLAECFNNFQTLDKTKSFRTDRRFGHAFLQFARQ